MADQANQENTPDHRNGDSVQHHSPDDTLSTPELDDSSFLNLSDESEEMIVRPRVQTAFDCNPDLGTKYAPGKRNQIENLDLTEVTYHEVFQTVQFNDILVQLNLEWIILVSLMFFRLGSKGVQLLVRQLCQFCLKPAFCRSHCGHSGLCFECGGGNHDCCLQCDALEEQKEKKLLKAYQEGKRKIIPVNAGKYLMVKQWFFTFTRKDAELLTKMMDTVCQGGLSTYEWKILIENTLKKFNMRKVKDLLKLNGAHKNIRLKYKDQSRTLLLCTLLARTELKCQTCHLNQRPPQARSVLHQCRHWRSCYDCIVSNDSVCLEEDCNGNLRKGHTVVEHTVLPSV